MMRPLAAVAALCAVLAGDALATVRLSESGGICAFENARFRLVVDANGGARIRSWVLKPSGRDLIGIWVGPRDVGGALDDRVDFTAVRYRPTVVRPGPDVAILRLEARNPAGLRISKTLTVRGDELAVRVSYGFRNAAQTPFHPFIRSMFVPGGSPMTPDHRYWVSVDPASGRQPVVDAEMASEYYRAAPPEFAALWNRRTGDGVMAYVPGVEQFYFWQGSKVFPTFEWLYPIVPAGKSMQASLVLVAVIGETSPPDWPALAGAHRARAYAPRTAPVAGWVDEPTRFRVTTAERERGLWLSTGEGSGKRRLPDPLPLDLPRDESRVVAVTLNPLRNLAAPVRVSIAPPWRSRIAVARDVSSPKRRELLPLSDAPVAMRSGTPETLRLRVSSRGASPGEYRVPLRLAAGSVTLPVNLRVRVWPVRASGRRPFEVRGYIAGPAALANGADVKPETTAHLTATLRPYAEMGGSVMDWLWGWSSVVSRVRLADTGEVLTEVARTSPERIDLARLPRLDFSYYAPWIAVMRRLGVTRIETYMEPPESPSWQGNLIDPSIGAGRVKAGTPEGARVIAWFYAEMKRWFQQNGFRGFFCKISDEIAPDSMPEYISAARVARAAGWRPFTTVTGYIAHTARHLRTMRPYCDQWQLNLMLKDDFVALTTARSGRPATVPVKPRDEVWFYGGESYPYRGLYSEAWAYPVMQIVHGFQGYGLWAYYCGSEAIVWVDPKTLATTVSPVWCGYRDGYRDALLFADVVRKRGRAAFDRIVGRSADAPVRVGWRTTEVYHYTMPLNAGDPLAVNAARRAALKALSAAP